MIKLGTLFSGIGAIEQTLLKMQIKHKIVFACDNGERSIKMTCDEIKEYLKNFSKKNYEKEIAKLYQASGKENLMERSYKANYHIDNNRFFQDVRFMDGTDFFNKVDLIVGGSPCQAFSCNGKRGGLRDTRGTLFYEYARIIKQSQPKSFIFENVKGMLNHDKGRTWETVKNVFNKLNYRIYIQKDSFGKESPIVDACDYGIPQSRKRIYIIGIRKDIHLKKPFEFPKPVPLTKTTRDFLETSVPAKYYLGEKGFNFVTTHPSRARINLPIMTCQKANQQFNWNGTFIFEELSNKHNKKILDKAFVGKWEGKKGVVRQFTPRECLRLMGFSDSFKIVVNDNMMWHQAGNSMVINVLEHIMKNLLETGIFD